MYKLSMGYVETVVTSRTGVGN